MKKIYILHEDYSPSHLFSLYSSKSKDYKIENYIIISHKTLLKRLIKSLIKRKKVFENIANYLKGIKEIVSLSLIKDSILIVGIAPYSSLMKKYRKVFKNNHSIYFTSFTYWNEKNKEVWKDLEKEEFIKVINEDFKSVACVSQKTKETIKPLLNSEIKIAQVKHSVDTENYLKKNLDSICTTEKKFIYLGQFIERKNVREILKAIKISNKKFKFDFAGSGNLEKEIIEFSKVDKRVRCLGRLENSEIKALLKSYDFLILPSKEEPYGIVLIEALSSGVPCIISEAIGPKEIIKENLTGLIIPKPVSIENILKR